MKNADKFQRAMFGHVPIQLKNGDDGFKVTGEIWRKPRQHNGWQSVTYRGKRYQLFGMVRTPYFIDLTNPIKGRR